MTYNGQASRGTTETLAERIVATSIQQHNVHAVVGIFHFGKNSSSIDRPEPDIGFLVYLRPYRDEVVDTVDLHAMASIIEKANAAPFQLVPEVFNGFIHCLKIGVLLQCYLETKALEGSGHIGSIVNRILQGAGTVGTITNDKGYPLFRSGR